MKFRYNETVFLCFSLSGAPQHILDLHLVMCQHLEQMKKDVVRDLLKFLPNSHHGPDSSVTRALEEINEKLDLVVPDQTPTDLPVPSELVGKLPCRTKADLCAFDTLMLARDQTLFNSTVSSSRKN